MPKQTTKPIDYPQAVLQQIEQLAQNIVVARKRRKETQAQWAKRLGVSQPTMARIERGDPSVAMASYVMCMWLIQPDCSLADLIAPQQDAIALEREIAKVRPQRLVMDSTSTPDARNRQIPKHQSNSNNTPSIATTAIQPQAPNLQTSTPSPLNTGSNAAPAASLTNTSQAVEPTKIAVSDLAQLAAINSVQDAVKGLGYNSAAELAQYAGRSSLASEAAKIKEVLAGIDQTKLAAINSAQDAVKGLGYNSAAELAQYAGRSSLASEAAKIKEALAGIDQTKLATINSLQNAVKGLNYSPIADIEERYKNPTAAGLAALIAKSQGTKP